MNNKMLVILLILFTVSGRVSAQGIEEITVTAQKREQSTQDISLSISAFTKAELREYGFKNLFDVAQHAPNVHVISYYDNSKPEIIIRGFGLLGLFTSFEQTPIGVYYDEVFSGSRSAHLAQMFDLERVEVLRGPQGTLYGRNTTGGAINFISRKPGDKFTAEGSVTYGRFDELNFEGGMDIPLSDTLALRIAGVKRDRDGYTKNVSGVPGTPDRLQDTDNWGARGILQWTPSDSMQWILNVHGYGSDTHSPAVHGQIGQGRGEPNAITGFVAPEGFHTLSINTAPQEDVDAWGVSLTGTIDFGDITVTSITAYEDVEAFELEDTDASPLFVQVFSVPDDFWQFSQEIRLASTTAGIDWLAGAYYYTDNLKANNFFDGFRDPLFGVASGFEADNFLDQDTENWAVFADMRWPVLEKFTLNGGIRYTSEDKELDADANVRIFFPDGLGGEIPFDIPTIVDGHVETDADDVTARAAIEWTPTEDIMIFGSYGRGFKSGGFNSQAFANISELTPYDPETVDAFEIGIRSIWFDNRFIFNATLFHQEVKDLQALIVIDDPLLGPLFFVRNAARATSKGVEIDIRAMPVEGLDIAFGLGLVDAEFDSFPFNDGTGRDATGNKMPTPSLTLNGLIQYEFPLGGGSTLTPRIDFSFVGDQYFDAQNRHLIDEQTQYAVANASLTWRSTDQSIEVQGWVRNLGDKEYLFRTIGNQAVSAGTTTSYHAPPRTYGVTFRYFYN